MNGLAIILTWAALLLLAVPYVRHIKHPRQKYLAAYLIFISVFSAIAFALFTLLTSLGTTLFGAEALDSTLGAALVIIATIVPAVWVATIFAKKPPREAPVI